MDEEKFNVLEAQLASINRQETVVSLSPSQEQLGNLLEYYQNGRLNDAEKLAVSVTQEFPQHPFGWKVLGAVLGTTGRKSEAADVNQTAVALSPQDAAAYSNLGNTLKDLGRLDEALASYTQAIALKPDLAEAHNNLGNTLKELGRLDEALASYRKAIALKPDYAEAHKNLGNTLKKLGRLDEALASYNQAIVFKPDFAEAMFNLSTTQSFMNDLEAEIVSLQNVLQIDSDDYGLRASVNLAICNFLKGDFTESKRLLLAATKIQEKTSSESKHGRVYWRYLSNILKWHKNKYPGVKKGNNDKNLYVVGESHSLTSHHLCIQNSGVNFFCSAKLIKGCKQWHLGNAFRNQYKHQFETIFFALPKHSYILLAIGEIDCRLDTGIIPHKRKSPEKQIKEIISNTIENYLNYIVNTNSDYQHNITIQGVPCPNLDVRNHSEKDIRQLGGVIKIFNYELKMQSKEKGFGFLDTHQLTNKGDGMSNGSWHIDDYHLSPEGMQEAWRRYGS
ncbi:MAG: tetratricopeptide repeat protein [Thalassobaculaceae bacterium]